MTEAEALRAIAKRARELADALRSRSEIANEFDALARVAQKALDDNPEFDWAALQALLSRSEISP